MIKRLKFKLYSKEEGRWLEWGEFFRDKQLHKILNAEYPNDKYESLVQYTGYNDHLGIELYENDIVGDIDIKGNLYRVTIQNGMTGIVIGSYFYPFSEISETYKLPLRRVTSFIELKNKSKLSSRL